MFKKFYCIAVSFVLIISCKKDAAQTTDSLAKASASNVTAITATPSVYFDSLFTRYNAGQWTGGDVAYSHLFPDGRSMWLFGDSFVDTVYPDRHRPPDAFIHSTIVLTDPQGLFNTLYKGTAQHPQPFFPSQEPYQLWPNCSFISKDEKHVYVLMVVIKETGEGGLFGFENKGNAVGILSLPDLKFEKTVVINNNPKIDWSAGTYEEGDYVYIYGTEPTPDFPYTKYMHVCRTLRSAPFQNLEFYTGTTWSKDSTKSARLQSGIASQFSVFKYNSKYYLLSQEGILLSSTIYMWDAASPVGPFTRKRKVYTTPQTDGKNIITYNATVHTEFTKNGKLLIGYCTNSLDAKDIYKNADNYRPYFIYIDNWQ